MDGSAKGFSSSTTIKPSAIPKFTTTDAGGIDENGKNFDKMTSDLDNPLKNPSIKHFMSPTISAVSKGSVPRKKILAERNEASNFTYTPNLDSKTTSLCAFDSSDPYSILVSEFDDDEQNTCVFGSSPYDPFTNYLAPRPKFLRYKPNRRREIFIDQENYSKREKDGSGVKSSACLVSQRNIYKSEKVQPSQERIVEQEKEKGKENPEEYSVEEIEEFEKRNFSILKEVMKFLFVFVILSFSTIYICSMNHPTHSWTPQATWGVKYGYQQIQNHSSEVVNFENFEGRERSLVQIEWTQFSIHDGFEEEVWNEEKITGLVENADEEIEVSDEEKQVTKIENWKDGYENADNLAIASEFFERVQGTLSVKYGYQQIQNHSSEVGNFDNFEGRERSLVQIDWTQFSIDDGFEEEVWNEEKTNGLVESADEEIEVPDEEKQVTKTENWEDGYENADNLAISNEFSEMVQGNWGVKHGYQQIQNHSSEIVNFEIFEVRERSLVQIEWTQFSIHDGFEKEVWNEEKIKGLVESGNEEIEVPDEEKRVTKTENWEDGYENADNNLAIANEFSERVQEKIMRFSVVIVMVALSLLGFGLWPKQSSLPIEKQLSESVLPQKPTIVDPVVVPNMDKIVLGVNSSLVIPSMEETTKKSNKIWAPTVELLGEFSVGEGRSCGMKSKMMEIDMSRNSIFQQKGLGSNRARAFSIPMKTPASEFSTMNSPSYGSFTAEKNVKKEEGKGGEAKKTSVTTSVRRSGRIRNRAVMSS